MKHWQMVGTKLNAVSAVTNIVGDRIYHGMRPVGIGSTQTVQFPCINYFEVPGDTPVLGDGEVERRVYQISSRGATPETAKQLAEEVELVFENMKETVGSTFSVNFVRITSGGGLLYEPVSRIYHAFTTVRFIFDSDQA